MKAQRLPEALARQVREMQSNLSAQNRDKTYPISGEEEIIARVKQNLLKRGMGPNEADEVAAKLKVKGKAFQHNIQCNGAEMEVDSASEEHVLPKKGHVVTQSSHSINHDI